jgi:hypothetical protein
MAAKALCGPLLRRRRSPRRRAVSPSAFTLLEITVATVILSIAIGGLFPLVAIISRDLQPVRKDNNEGRATYQCTSPARDGNTLTTHDPAPPSGYVQHTWYLAPVGDLTATTANANTTTWARKLGASARLLAAPMPVSLSDVPTAFSSVATPSPVAASMVRQDDYEGAPGSNDGSGTFAVAGAWTYAASVPDAFDSDTHRHEALVFGQISSDMATWTLTVPADGWYSVQATWPASSDQVDDAVFTVFKNGAQLTGSPVFVNQSIAPVGVTDAQSRTWAYIVPSTLQLAKNDVIVVQLTVVRGSNSTEVGKFVVADAVRLAQNEVAINSVSRAIGSANKNADSPQADVTAHVTVTVNLPE